MLSLAISSVYVLMTLLGWGPSMMSHSDHLELATKPKPYPRHPLELSPSSKLRKLEIQPRDPPEAPDPVTAEQTQLLTKVVKVVDGGSCWCCWRLTGWHLEAGEGRKKKHKIAMQS